MEYEWIIQVIVRSDIDRKYCEGHLIVHDQNEIIFINYKKQITFNETFRDYNHDYYFCGNDVTTNIYYWNYLSR